MRHPLSHASTPIEPEAAEAAPRQEWPADAPPPPTPELPEPPPITFGIARPARLLGIAWAVSVPAVLWSHIKFSNPVAVVVVAGGVLAGVGIATGLAWGAFHALKRSRNAASGIFGGLACVGLACNVLLGVFMSLAAGALREIDRGPGTVRTQLKQELAIAKKVAREELVKVQDEGVKGLLKETPAPTMEPAPVSPDLVLTTPSEKEPEQAPSAAQAVEIAANAPAEVAQPAPQVAAAHEPEQEQPKPVAKPKAVVKTAAKPAPKPTPVASAPKPQVNVPQRGISVRKAGSAMPEPVVATIDEATVDRVAYEAAVSVQDRVDKASRRYADSALRLTSMRDPLLYHSQTEFRDFRRALDQHRTDAEALREAVVTAAGQMQTRLSQAGVPVPVIERHVSMAFPADVSEASAEFHDAYLAWLDARERRAMILETSLGRWKYNAGTKQLWLADDGVRSACESAFDSVKASSSVLASKREQAEELGITTRASEMRSQVGRFAGENAGS